MQIKIAKKKSAAKKIEAQAIKRIKENRFDVILYASGPKDSGYQINQWIPVAEQMKWKSAVCVRKFYLLDEIDDVLESNAEDFVKSYVQKGGE